MAKSDNCIAKKTDESKLFLLICHVVDNLVTLPDKVFGRGKEKTLNYRVLTCMLFNPHRLKHIEILTLTPAPWYF